MTSDNENIVGSGEFNDELQQMRQKRKQRTRKKVTIIAVIAAVAVAIALIVTFIQINRSYSSYTIISSESREDEAGAKYTYYKEGYIRCSGGGVERVNIDGEKVWNTVHTMTNPSVKTRDNIICIGDINGNAIEVFDENGMLSRADTQFPILQTEVSSSGLVAAVLQDNDDNYINMYDKAGEYIYSIKTSIRGEGYPVDIAISDDGKKLAVSYVRAEGNLLETGIRFYDFGSGEKDSAETGRFNNFGGKPVGVVEFFGNDTVVAVAGDSVTFYSAENSKEKKRIETEGTVNKVIFEDNKFALIYSSGRICVYDPSGKVMSDVETDTLYSDYHFYDNSIIMKNDNSFAVMDISGKFVTKQDTEIPVIELVPNGAKDRYFFINERFIQRIRLT